MTLKRKQFRKIVKFVYDFAKPTDFMNEENFHLDLQNLSQSLYSELRDFFRQSARCGSALSICSDGRGSAV
jgi:hypothetical protein